MNEEKATARTPGGSSDMNEAFAKVEDTGGTLAIGVMIVAFVVYVSGVLEPIVSLRELPGKIGAGVDRFVQENNMPAGWGFLARLGQGDMLALAAMMLVVLVVVTAYLMLIPGLVRRRDFLYLGLVVLQLAVFVVASGGWLGGGH